MVLQEIIGTLMIVNLGIQGICMEVELDLEPLDGAACRYDGRGVTLQIEHLCLPRNHSPHLSATRPINPKLPGVNSIMGERMTTPME